MKNMDRKVGHVEQVDVEIVEVDVTSFAIQKYTIASSSEIPCEESRKMLS